MNASFFQVWIDALSKPTEENYVAISQSPGASLGTASLWVFLGSAVGLLFTGLEQLMFGGLGTALSQALGTSGDTGLPPELGSSAAFVICGPLVGGVFAILGLFIGAGLTQWIAGMLGGQGSFTKLAYAVAAFSAPFSLLSGLLAGIPFVNFCVGLAGFYALFLQILAVKAVNRFDWGKAVIAALAIPVLFTIACCCLWLVGAATLAPIIGNVFSQMNSGLVP